MRILKIKFRHQLLLTTLLLFVGCNNNEQSDKVRLLTKENDSLKVVIKQNPTNVNQLLDRIKEKLVDSRTGVWITDTTSEDVRITFAQEYPNATPSELVKKLNEVIPTHFNPGITLIRTVQDEIFVKVNDDELLTERMGTSGANEYLAKVTFTLTSIRGIRCVNFDFSEGDHAVPGKYYRNSFISLL